jgi:hypothetical protein
VRRSLNRAAKAKAEVQHTTIMWCMLRQIATAAISRSSFNSTLTSEN